MEAIRAAAPDVITGASTVDVADFVFRLRDGRLHGFRPVSFAFQVPPEFDDTVIVSAESVQAAHALGVEVHVWTINDEAEMDRLLDLGVDGLMSDFPARAMAVLRRRGLR
jgi:glycerophosphoryl diester phosphodiesterase